MNAPVRNFENIKAQQVLPAEAYTSQEWFDRELTDLWGKTWAFAGSITDLKNPGDYITVQQGHYPLVVVKGKDNEIRAFHNLCRHRGAQILEGKGNCGSGLKCKYHYWMFNLDGSVRGIPLKDELLPECDKSQLGLKDASIGIVNGAVFVHPLPNPEQSFEDFMAGLEKPDTHWPHELEKMEEAVHTRYRVKANWKLLFENANDGYHLSYLHEKTLAGPIPQEQETFSYGQHSTYRASMKYYTELVEKTASPSTTSVLGEGVIAMSEFEPAPGVEEGDREAKGPDLYFMFPNVIVAVTGISLAFMVLNPVAPNETIVDFRFFVAAGKREEFMGINQFVFRNQAPVEVTSGYNPTPVSLDMVEMDAMETKNFHLEDMWIVEKMQNALYSPAYEPGPYTPGPGEGSITFFQTQVARFMDPELAKKAVIS